MPEFIELEPHQVLLGRELNTAAERELYRDFVARANAGHIRLGPDDKPTRVKRMLSEGARAADVRIRSSWTDRTKTQLNWKRVVTETRALG